MQRRKQYVFRRHRDEAIGLLVRDLRGLPTNRDYLVTLERMDEPVSDGQRKLFWKWMGIMGDDIGLDKEEFYDQYIKNGPILQGRGISEIGTDLMHETMTAIQQYCAAEGYILPSTLDEYYTALDEQQRQQHDFRRSK
jgi:hypothetical protein